MKVCVIVGLSLLMGLLTVSKKKKVLLLNSICKCFEVQFD